MEKHQNMYFALGIVLQNGPDFSFLFPGVINYVQKSEIPSKLHLFVLFQLSESA